MKKVLFTIAAAVMMFAATSCKKESINEPEVMRDPEANEFLATIDGGAIAQNAPKVGNGMNTMATFDQTDKLKVMWQQGDVIYVNGTANAFTCNSDPKNSNRAYFENKTGFPTGYQAEEYHAFYSTSVSPNANAASGTLSAIQYYNPGNQAENLPMYAHSTDHWLNFSNICAAVKIYVPCTADHIVIKNTSAAMNGAFKVQSNVAVMQGAPDDDNKKITIYKGTQGHTEAFNACDSLYIAIPAGTYHGFEIAFLNQSEDTIYTTGKGGNLTVEANKLYRIVGYKYTDVLPGKFSVSATQQKVQFTVGNLLRTGSTTYVYSFEEKQTGYRNTKLERMADGKDYYGYYNNCDQSYTVGDSTYNVLTSDEMIYLLRCGKRNGSSTTPTPETKARPNAAGLNAFAYVNDGTKDILCLLVAPDDATGFKPSRTKYTLKEVNSMGLLCLPMAGYIQTSGGDNTAPVAITGKPYDGEISARYWAPKSSQTSNSKDFLQVDIVDGTLNFNQYRIYESANAGSGTISRSIRLVKRL